MSKIIYLPLDERPCNWSFPRDLFNNENFVIESMPDALKGYKKRPSDKKQIDLFLQNASNLDGIVISLDMLIYGGLIPSRLHYDKVEDLVSRLNLLNELKKKHPKMIIYGYSTIMRCPTYSSNDEEHDYYGTHGRQIYDYGVYLHKDQLKIITDNERKAWHNLNIPQAYLEDFTDRRKINLSVNLAIIDYVDKGIIDFLVIPQDDSGQYGFTALDQDMIYNKVSSLNLADKVYLYPGADEVGSILLARICNKINKRKPKIYLKYPSPTSPTIFPLIEDRYLDITVRYQILASGGIISDNIYDSDAVLYIHASADTPLTSLIPTKPTKGVTTLLNTVEAFEFLTYAHNVLNKPIMIADVAYDNGSHLECFQNLSLKNLVFKLASYAGWNTSSNTIGSAVAMGMSYLNNGLSKNHLDMLVTRYIEDVAFGGYVRQIIWYEKLPNLPLYSYYNTIDEDGYMSELVKSEIIKFINDQMDSLKNHYQIISLKLPWKRLYEIDLKASYQK